MKIRQHKNQSIQTPNFDQLWKVDQVLKKQRTEGRKSDGIILKQQSQDWDQYKQQSTLQLSINVGLHNKNEVFRYGNGRSRSLVQDNKMLPRLNIIQHQNFNKINYKMKNINSYICHTLNLQIKTNGLQLIPQK